MTRSLISTSMDGEGAEMVTQATALEIQRLVKLGKWHEIYVLANIILQIAGTLSSREEK